MRTIATFFVIFAVGCGSKSQNNNPGGSGGPDGGPGSGVILLPDGGYGLPDGGVALPDGGIPTCDNTIQRVPMEARCHIGELPLVPPCDTLTVPIPYRSNPPTAGPHYPDWATWAIHTAVVPREYWVHNLEHGGVIFLYRPDAPRGLIDALTRVYNQIPDQPECVAQGIPHKRVVLTPDPLLDVPWAVTVSQPELPNPPPYGDGLVIKDYCIGSEQALVNFAVQYRDHSVEHICDQGTYQ